MQRIDKIAVCNICKSSKRILIKSTCDHKICSYCMHRQIFYIFDEFINFINSDDTHQLTCIVCQRGEFITTTQDLIKFLDLINPKYEIDEEICENHGKKVKIYCKSCRIKMCALCMEDHPDDHDCETLKENICNMHREKLHYQCNDCNHPICKTCSKINHKNHKLSRISDYMNNLKSELEDVIKPYINEHINKFNYEEYKILESVKKDFTDLHTAIGNLITFLYDFNASLSDSLKEIENKYLQNTNLVKRLFINYHNDLDKIKSYDYENLNYLNKIPKNITPFKYQKLIDTDSIKFALTRIRDDLSKLKEENLNHKNINRLYECVPISKLRRRVKLKFTPYKCIKTLNGHKWPAYSITQLDNNIIASASRDKTIKLWDGNNSYNCILTLNGHSGGVYSVAQLSNNLIASGSVDKSIKVWDGNNNYKCIMTLTDHKGTVYSVIQLDNKMMASASKDKTIKIWDTNISNSSFKCICTLIGHTDEVRSITQIKNQLIASSSSDKTIKIWEMQNYKCVQTLVGHMDEVRSVIQLKNGVIVSSSCDESIKVWDIQNYKCQITLCLELGTILSLTELEDNLIASASYDNIINIIDANKNYEVLQTLKGHTDHVNKIIRLPNGLLASASQDNTIKLWI